MTETGCFLSDVDFRKEWRNDFVTRNQRGIAEELYGSFKDFFSKGLGVETIEREKIDQMHTYKE